MEKTTTREDEDGMELTVPLSVGEHVVDQQGYCYKQYHDESAGFTLQNQYTAAYKRWLAFEADYEQALARFKMECNEAGVDWRQFLRKAKQQKEQKIQQESCEFESVPDDEGIQSDLYDDDELLRFVGVLWTLRDNCSFAKEVMDRIQRDINEMTKLEDLRHQIEAAPSVNTLEPGASNSNGIAPNDAPSEASNLGLNLANAPSSVSSRKSDQDQENFAFFSTVSKEAFESFPTINGINTNPYQSFGKDDESYSSDQKASMFPSDTDCDIDPSTNLSEVEQKGINLRILPRRIREGKPAGDGFPGIQWTDWKLPLRRNKKDHEPLGF
jgi:hypothetical protein